MNENPLKAIEERLAALERSSAIANEVAERTKSKLEKEVTQIEQSITNTRFDRTWCSWARWRDFLVAIGSVAPMIAIAILIWQFSESLEKDSIIHEREERRLVSETINNLAHNNPTVRIATATSLATRLNQEGFVEPIMTALIGALLHEHDMAVRGALLSSILLGETAALTHARAALPAARLKLDELSEEIVLLNQQKHQLTVDGRATDVAQTEALLRTIERERRSLQHAIVALALDTRQFIPEAECQRSQGCPHCRASLTSLNLDRFNFSRAGMELCNVNFNRSSLVGVDFSNLDIRGADFGESDLREAHFAYTDASDANFNGAQIEWRREGTGSRPLAYFFGANLSGSTFAEACLSGADFRGAQPPILAEQMEEAYAAGARFDRSTSTELEAAGALRQHPKCRLRS